MKITLVFTLFFVLMGAMMASITSPGCLCLNVYNPVCGQDGITYGNSCDADCEGVQVEHKGEC